MTDEQKQAREDLLAAAQRAGNRRFSVRGLDVLDALGVDYEPRPQKVQDLAVDRRAERKAAAKAKSKSKSTTKKKKATKKAAR